MRCGLATAPSLPAWSKPYSTPIYRLALKMLAREQDAEDVLQNTFLKALQHIRNFEGRSSLSTWLYRIAANEALMLLRRKRSEVSIDEEPTETDESLPLPEQFTDWCCLPEQEFATAEARRQARPGHPELRPKNCAWSFCCATSKASPSKKPVKC